MSKPLVLVVFGTRPEAIKLAPVIRALACSGDVRVEVCVTAQHREMLDSMLESFDIVPDHDLDLMQAGQDLNGFTSRALPRLQATLKAVAPDYVLVQGDTTTAFVTALAAFYEGIPVGHVEAGLRSFDLANPFPEEANRALISRLADLHFAPTPTAAANLRAEGIPSARILTTGNTVVDALMIDGAKTRAFRDPLLRESLARLREGDTAVVVTTHRRENHGEPLLTLCAAFTALVERHEGLHLFYPVHMNPKVRAVVTERLRHPRAHLLPALDYFDLMGLLRRSSFVLTDSGGLQEEAPALGKPVVVLREVTERPEAVEAGVAVLAGTATDSVVREATRLLVDARHYAAMSRGSGVYGDGRASERIVAAIRHKFGISRLRAEQFLPVMGASK